MAIAIVQARMGSTRLPGKVLMDVAGRTMLERVVTRTGRAKLIRDVVVATTTNSRDDLIEALCKEKSWSCFRGSEDDVLDRYYQAASVYGPDDIVRITSDCPLTDPEVVDRVVQSFLEGQPNLDFVSNNMPTRTFPLGLDVEVMQFSALEKAWRADKNPNWREHVTLYIYRHPELFTTRGIANDTDYSSMRWTVDTREDVEFVRRIYEYFGHDRFSWLEVIGALRKHADWLAINRKVKQKPDPP